MLLFGGEMDGTVPDETETVAEPLLAATDLGAWDGLPLAGGPRSASA